MDVLFQDDDDVIGGGHLGKQVSSIQFRDVWTDTAEVLLENVSDLNYCVITTCQNFTVVLFAGVVPTCARSTQRSVAGCSRF